MLTMRRVRASLLPALLTLLPLAGAGPLQAQQEGPRPLSLREALELARANNPAFQASRNDVDVAAWGVRSAWGALTPSASLSGGVSWQGAGSQQIGSITLDELGFGDQPDYYFSSYGVNLGMQIDGGTVLGPSRARANQSATAAQVEVARLNLETAVTNAYLEALRQRDGVELAEQQLERARFNLRLAQGQEEVGTATPLDVRQAEVQVGRSEVALLQARNAVETARLRLLQQMGVSLDEDVSLVSEFEVTRPAWTEDQLLEMALADNPTLLARRRARETADVDVKIARSAYLPSVSLSAGWSGFTRQASSTDFLLGQAQSQVLGQIRQCQATNELYSRLANPLPPLDCSQFVFSDEDRRRIIQQNDVFPLDFERNPPTARLSVSLPVFQGLGRQQQVEAARAQRADARHQLREQELALEADVAIRTAGLETAFQSAELESRNQLLADEQLRLARERYRLGFIPFLDLLEAETVKVQADRDLLNAVYAYHDALTALEAVVGRSLRTP